MACTQASPRLPTDPSLLTDSLHSGTHPTDPSLPIDSLHSGTHPRLSTDGLHSGSHPRLPMEGLHSGTHPRLPTDGLHSGYNPSLPTDCIHSGTHPRLLTGTMTCSLPRMKMKRTQEASPTLDVTISPHPKSTRRLRTGTENPHCTTRRRIYYTVKPWEKSKYKYSCVTPPYYAKINFALSPRCSRKTCPTGNTRGASHLPHIERSGEQQVPRQDCNQHARLFLNDKSEKSNVKYLEVMDAVADSADTMMQMLHNLQDQYITGQSRQRLAVEGDAKVYNILKSLKFEYGEEYEWLIPYPRDWHMLENFQNVLMMLD